MAIERRKVLYEGRVQGIGFRMTSARLASAFPVAGHVRNLDDGRVEILVEGERSAIINFLSAVRREFGGAIRDLTETIEAAGESSLVVFSIHQ